MPLHGVGRTVVAMELLRTLLLAAGATGGLLGLVVLLVGAAVAPLVDGDLGRPRRRAA